MKNFISTVIAVSLFLPVMAQKKPVTKTKSTPKTEVVDNSSKDRKIKEAISENDSTKLEIKMDKPLDIYFDSLNLSKEQRVEIDKIDDFLNSRKDISRAKIKMSKEEIAMEESDNLKFRNNKIYDILSPKQIKEIYLLQNGKLKEKLSFQEILDHMDLKPSQIEEIKNIRSQFKTRFDEVNKIDDEMERIDALNKLNNEIEKQSKTVLMPDQIEYLEGVKSGKIEFNSDTYKKDQEIKKSDSKIKD